MDRREFLRSAGAAALFPSALFRRAERRRRRARLDRRQRRRQPVHAGAVPRLSQLDQADVGDDLAAAGDARRRSGDPADPRARRPARHQAAARASARSARAPRSFNAQLGTLEEQVARALKASQIFGATCMRCVLGGDPERPQIEMHIDNMIKAVRGHPLAHRRFGRQAGGREPRRRSAGARDEDDDRGGRHRRHGRLPRLGQSGVDARGSAHDARDADSLRGDLATSATARSGRCRRGSPCAGSTWATATSTSTAGSRSSSQAKPGLPIIFENLVSANPRIHRDLRPEVLGQLATHAGIGAQSLPGSRGEGHAEARNAAARRERPRVSSGSRISKCA